MKMRAIHHAPVKLEAMPAESPVLIVSVYRLDRFTRPVGLVVHGTLATRRLVKNLFRELLDLD